MKSGGPWNLRGLRPETRKAAREAARRTGMSVGEWLNSVIEPDEDDDREPMGFVDDEYDDGRRPEGRQKHGREFRNEYRNEYRNSSRDEPRSARPAEPRDDYRENGARARAAGPGTITVTPRAAAARRSRGTATERECATGKRRNRGTIPGTRRAADARRSRETNIVASRGLMTASRNAKAIPSATNTGVGIASARQNVSAIWQACASARRNVSARPNVSARQPSSARPSSPAKNSARLMPALTG